MAKLLPYVYEFHSSNSMGRSYASNEALSTESLFYVTRHIQFSVPFAEYVCCMIPNTRAAVMLGDSYSVHLGF